MPINLSIETRIQHLLGRTHLRMTPCDLERAICQAVPGTTRKAVRAAVRSLMNRGELIYTHHFSSTHLEINYRQAARVSDRIVLSSSSSAVPTAPGMISIRLHDGAAFGAGDHPTTRMIMRGLDFVLGAMGVGRDMRRRQALDIGTGTGILAIVAAALGVDRVVAVDTDPMACREATMNVRHNGCDERISISNQPLANLSKNTFDFILVNLRPPTIRQLLPEIANLSFWKTVWFLSGFRVEEKSRVIELLPEGMSNIIWREEENGWAAIAAMRLSIGNEAEKCL